MAREFTGGPVKIHFAGAEQVYWYAPAYRLSGGRFALGSAYPFIADILGIKHFPITYTPPGAEPRKDFLKFISGLQHGIIDSGLYTLLFGAASDIQYDSGMIRNYTDALLDFYGELPNAEKDQCTCIEVDCQKLAGAEFAWELREYMRQKLSKHDIMNVWHPEDGWVGLDRLIEFSNYLALPVVELRRSLPRDKCLPTIRSLVEYIHLRRSDLRIHLLGCTDLRILSRLNGLVFSSDSISWQEGMRWKPRKGRASIVGWEPEEKAVAEYLTAAQNTGSWSVSSKKLVLKATVAMVLARKSYRAVLGIGSC